jgi:hypothetical protein
MLSFGIVEKNTNLSFKTKSVEKSSEPGLASRQTWINYSSETDRAIAKRKIESRERKSKFRRDDYDDERRTTTNDDDMIASRTLDRLENQLLDAKNLVVFRINYSTLLDV